MTETRDGATRASSIDRHFWFCLLLTVIVVVPRAMLIARAHSAYVDDEHHLDQGLAAIRRGPHPLTYYDPPLGKMILAIPLQLAGVEVRTVKTRDGAMSPIRHTVLYHQRLSVQTLRLTLGVWKALLFVPCVLIVFVWCRHLYGLRAAWLAAALFLVDPTITGHAVAPALDVLAMEAVIVASFLIWRYFNQPTVGRLIGAGVATAAAMLVKHTAFFLPAAIVALALLHWFVRPWWQGEPLASLKRRIRPGLNSLAAGALVVVASIWVLTLFNFSAPAEQRKLMDVSYERGFTLTSHVIEPLLTARLPGGVYIGSLIGALEHSKEGQSCFLWGELSVMGWWYYFPAVALYKVPVGIWVVIGIALASYALVRPKWEEVFVWVPLLACAALILNSQINVGFRHALPTYGLVLILASRTAFAAGAVRFSIAWLGVALAAAHSLWFHPDYITFVNAPWRRPYLAISDSNLDWGQSLLQFSRWLDEHPQPNRTISFDPFNDLGDPGLDHYVGGRVRVLVPKDPVPTEGLLVLSPARLAGVYYVDDKYAHLRYAEPLDVIGHCLLVYDLDAMKTRTK